MVSENEVDGSLGGYEAQDRYPAQHAVLASRSAFLDMAQKLAGHGLAVIPVQPRGKTPLTSHGCKDASTIPETINAWWARWPDANIGIATGAISGIWVLDIDGDDGESSLRRLEEQNSPLPTTVEVISGGKGRHLYFRYPALLRINNSARKLGAGLDVRGDGGYIVAPPSVHPSGALYMRSVDSEKFIAEAPDWLLKLVTERTQGTAARLPEEWMQMIDNNIGEGRRNDSIARIAGLLFACGLDPYLTLALCMAVNDSRCQPPLPEAEVIKTVNSIAQRELQKNKG